MGVFITIKGSYPCPRCGQELSDWQCKKLVYDGYPIMIAMQYYQLNKKMDGEMHTICPTCGYVRYTFAKGRLAPQRNEIQR